MRISLVILCLIFCGTGSYAQFTKGTITVGGQLGYEYTTISPNDKAFLYTVNSFSIDPEVGIFFVPNLMTGILLSYTHSSFKPGEENQITSGKSIYNGYGAGVFVRYYYNYIFTEGRYELGGSKNEHETTNQSSKSDYHNVHFGIGYSFLISKEIAIEPKLSYKLLASGDSGENKVNVLAFTLGIRGFITRNRAE